MVRMHVKPRGQGINKFDMEDTGNLARCLPCPLLQHVPMFHWHQVLSRSEKCFWSNVWTMSPTDHSHWHHDGIMTTSWSCHDHMQICQVLALTRASSPEPGISSILPQFIKHCNCKPQATTKPHALRSTSCNIMGMP